MKTAAVALAKLRSVRYTKNTWSQAICWEKERRSLTHRTLGAILVYFSHCRSGIKALLALALLVTLHLLRSLPIYQNLLEHRACSASPSPQKRTMFVKLPSPKILADLSMSLCRLCFSYFEMPSAALHAPQYPRRLFKIWLKRSYVLQRLDFASFQSLLGRSTTVSKIDPDSCDGCLLEKHYGGTHGKSQNILIDTCRGYCRRTL